MKKKLALVATGLIIYVIGFEKGGNFAQETIEKESIKKIDRLSKAFSRTIHSAVRENLTEEQIAWRLNEDIGNIINAEK